MLTGTCTGRTGKACVARPHLQLRLHRRALLRELDGVTRRLPVGHLLQRAPRRRVRLRRRLALGRERHVEALALGRQLARLLLEGVGEPLELRGELRVPRVRARAQPLERGLEGGALALEEPVEAPPLALDGLAPGELRVRERLAQRARLLAAERRVVRGGAAHRRHVGVGDEQHVAQREHRRLLGEVVARREAERVAALGQLPLEPLPVPARLRLHLCTHAIHMPYT